MNACLFCQMFHEKFKSVKSPEGGSTSLLGPHRSLGMFKRATNNWKRASTAGQDSWEARKSMVIGSRKGVSPRSSSEYQICDFCITTGTECRHRNINTSVMFEASSFEGEAHTNSISSW